MDCINLKYSEWICWCYCFSCLSNSALCTFSPSLALQKAQDLFYIKQYLPLTGSKIQPGVETRESSFGSLEGCQMLKESEFLSCIPILEANSILNLLIILRKSELCPWFVIYFFIPWSTMYTVKLSRTVRLNEYSKSTSGSSDENCNRNGDSYYY